MRQVSIVHVCMLAIACIISLIRIMSLKQHRQKDRTMIR